MAPREGERHRAARFSRADQAVSPIIGVILMVAITVVISATVMVLVGTFAQDTQGPAFPQVKLRAADAPTDGLDTGLFTVEHLAGDCVNLMDYRFTLERPDGSSFEPTVTDNDDDVWCVADTLVLGESAVDDTGAGDRGMLLRLKVVDLISEAIVFDGSRQLA